MGLNHFFDKDLVFCLQADNKEHLFSQVADLLEKRKIVTSSYKKALIEREKSFPTGLDMEFFGKGLPNVAIPHTDMAHNLAEKVVVVRLEQSVIFHNMIAPTKEVEVSLLFFIINNSGNGMLLFVFITRQRSNSADILSELTPPTKKDDITDLVSLKLKPAIYARCIKSKSP